MIYRRLTPRRIIILLVGLASLGGLVIWSAVALKEPKLTIAIHQGIEGVALRKIAAEFSEREKISVEVVDWPYDQLFEEEKRDLHSDSPRYDVLMLDDPWLPALIEQKTAYDKAKFQKLVGGKNDGLAPMFSETESREQLKWGDFVEPTLRVCRNPYHTGDYYALPFVGNSQLFCILTKDFDTEDVKARKVLNTWHDVLTESQRIIKLGRPHGYIMRVGKGNPIVTDFLPVLWEADPNSLPEGELRLLDEVKTKPAFQFLVDLGKTGKDDFSIVAFDDFDLAIHLAKQKASMNIVWSAWAMAIARVGQMEGLKFIDMPGATPALGAWLLAVSANSDHKDEAKKFLLFATSEHELRRAAEEGNPPPRTSILKDPELTKDPELNKRFRSFADQYDSLSKSRPRTRTPNWRAFEDKMGECLSDLYADVITPEDAISRVNCAITQFRKDEGLPTEPNAPDPRDCVLSSSALHSHAFTRGSQR